MHQLPSHFATMILSFAPLFFQRSWRHAEGLLLGAILAPGTRTVARLLRITGLAQERHFVNYHRVLNRAVWNPRAAAGRLLRLLIAAFVPRGPVVLGLDDPIERRRGTRLAAKGIYRDPVRSSHGHFVKASAAIDPTLRIVFLPRELTVPAPFGLTVLNGASPDGQKFAQHILSPQGQQILASYGFIPSCYSWSRNPFRNFC